MLIRPFDPERDRAACHRIWRECGWIKAGEEPQMDHHVDAGRALVAEINGEAEGLVLAASAYLRYLDADIPLSAITGVTTSFVARKQGVAARTLARMIAQEAEAGAMVSGLGMFEQGYYNQLGYGTSAYVHKVAFDPADLMVSVRMRPPIRLSADDFEAVHANRLARMRGHGACTLLPVGVTRAEMRWGEGFGLGYRDAETGAVTHHVWLYRDEPERGPYGVHWIAYRSLNELMELLALIRSLGEQVRLVKMEDPAGIVLQDLIRQPFKRMSTTDKGKYATGVRSYAPFQFRICDLPRCLAQTKLPFGEARFNLELSDPIVEYLPSDASWRGAGGSYRVVLGQESYAEAGADSALPTLTASVGTFTRLWLGARTATSLAVTDGLTAPPTLLQELDVLLRLPTPRPDWDF